MLSPIKKPLTNVFGITHIDIQTTNLTHAEELYRDVLGFTELKRNSKMVDLDAGGTITLKLNEVKSPIQPSTLRVQASDVQLTISTLLDSRCQIYFPAMRTEELTLTGAVRDTDGNIIVVWRALNEDEYEHTPELPKEMIWADEADALLKVLLKGVPSLFRALARRKIVRVVEELAEDHKYVTREEVIRGFILASPKITRARNRKPLIEAGIDIDLYQTEWDSP
jgi:predicted enzyme related to lactoylglutathione lyase